MNTKVVIVGILGALGVALGAFGAHGLTTILPAENIDVYKTAVFYHLIHVLPLLILALYERKTSNRIVHKIFVLFFLGILFFSGSLYILSFKLFLSPLFVSIIGPITPIGGMCFIIGWIYLAYWGYRNAAV